MTYTQGGCPYDLPIGACGEDRPLNATRGCAEGMQRDTNNKLIPYANFVFETRWIQVSCFDYVYLIYTRFFCICKTHLLHNLL